MRETARRLLLLFSALCLPVALTAQAAVPVTIQGLGSIAFPVVSHSSAADTQFVRGVLLLHLFEYDEAAAAFRHAERIDPAMAMAYWGEAMTYTHPVWDEQDLPAARAALAKLAPTATAREAMAVTPRERGYLRAVDILYGDGPKARRDTLYAQAMGALLAANPRDDEARAFYALSLMGLSQGVRNVPTYLHAAAIAESVYARNPRHPGAAHYWIHALDDPDHAAAALPAARALSKIAPDADHAQHMTSHIFMALGMWPDVVRANENAMRVVDAALAAHGRGPRFCGHYNFWLEYGYLELSRVDDARALMERCQRQAEAARTAAKAGQYDPDNSPMASAVTMWSRYVLDSQDWSDTVAQWTPSLAGAAAPHATWEFTRGFAAAKRGDTATSRIALAAFQQDRAQLSRNIAGEREPDPNDAEYLKRLGVLDLELQALTRFSGQSADTAAALTLLQRATVLEDSMAYAFGPPNVDKPSHELYGEVLFTMKRFAAAEHEFQMALGRAPGRELALRGLASTQAAMHARR
ncbi:MAG TPA: hypothetical protein VFW89_10290 [Gemmatimonadaceae bacterium]|nr:hypothetical protein [Gemmatimonadaceae bacterium]